MTLLNLYAAAPVSRTAVQTSGHAVIETTGTYLERLYFGHFTDAVVAVDALLMASERRKCFHENQGWYEVPDGLTHELWARDATGTPRHIVARTTADTITVASEFAATLPHGLNGVYASFAAHYRLITNERPIRTSLLRQVITPGGQLPAEGA